MSENVMLRGKQSKALLALISQPTLQRASEEAGISTKTLYRYLRMGNFRAELAKHESLALDTASRRLVSGFELSLNTLEKLMREGKSESVQLQASNIWLTHTLKLIELRSLEERISKLEREVKHV